MIIFKKTNDLQHWLQKQKAAGKKIGFVPTMGALHQGHISLINICKSKSDITVCSIFVNPAQFNDPKDFEKYPITLENDIKLLEFNGTNVLFLPSVKEIYPQGINHLQHYDLGMLENMLEGFYRPGHFQGVCNVVHRLLNIVQPYVMFLGQKDYQQCMVIRKMIEDCKLGVNLEIVSTLRENNGLAMSSRNMRLSNEARKNASAIYKALMFIKNNIVEKGIEECKGEGKEIILSSGFDKIDYVEICDAVTLQPITEIKTAKHAVALVAAFTEGVRLIDNMQLF